MQTTIRIAECDAVAIVFANAPTGEFADPAD
jgi:hypothetical protein